MDSLECCEVGQANTLGVECRFGSLEELHHDALTESILWQLVQQELQIFALDEQLDLVSHAFWEVCEKSHSGGFLLGAILRKDLCVRAIRQKHLVGVSQVANLAHLGDLLAVFGDDNLCLILGLLKPAQELLRCLTRLFLSLGFLFLELFFLGMAHFFG